MNIRNRRLALAAFAAGVAFLLASACSTTRPPRNQVSDAWISSKVETKLAADPDINNFEIDVDTEDGVVRLSGMVEEDSDRTKAERIARDTVGVIDVRNEIGLGDPTLGENVTDAWIVTKVKSKLAADPQTNPWNIQVDAVQGVVTLTGVVPEEKDREEAVRLASDTRGVVSVDDRIRIQSR